MTEWYSLQEIQKIFYKYKNLNLSNLNDSEYKDFCKMIKILPREIVDRISQEIRFVLMSAGESPNSRKPNSACTISLEGLNEKAIIILSPIIFGFGIKSDENWRDSVTHNTIHEIAHYVLGHTGYENQEDHDNKERLADEQAAHWIWDFYARECEDDAGEEEEGELSIL